MKTNLLAFIILFASAGLAQDSGFDFYIPDDAAINRATAACGSDKVKFDVSNADTPQPDPVIENGKALVYLIGYGDAITKIGLDGGWVGANLGDSYFPFAVPPGEHHLCIKWQSIFHSRSDLVALDHFDAEAGKSYYFEIKAYDRNNGRVFRLEPVNSDQGKLLVACRPLTFAHPKTKK